MSLGDFYFSTNTFACSILPSVQMSCIHMHIAVHLKWIESETNVLYRHIGNGETTALYCGNKRDDIIDSHGSLRQNIH